MDGAPRCIASHAAESDYTPATRALLWKLGYRLLPADEAPAPDLRVVREDRLAELPARASEPMILLTDSREPRPHDTRFLGSVPRPASLHELYRLIQCGLEEHPRSVPRVPASLAARARSEGHLWQLVVVSLSENGCLVTGPIVPPLDTALEIEIELPWGEQVGGPALVSYEQGGSLGLVFHGIRIGERKRLAKAVLKLLDRL
jgi:hypothetical protein